LTNLFPLDKIMKMIFWSSACLLQALSWWLMLEK
jgi:hypothetical protein